MAAGPVAFHLSSEGIVKARIVDGLSGAERYLGIAALREHDKRVEEYSELEKLLPRGLEIAAIRNAANTLREKGHGFVADILSAYVDRLAKAGRTGL